MKRVILLTLILSLVPVAEVQRTSGTSRVGEWDWNSFDHWDSFGALRVDLGFYM